MYFRRPQLADRAAGSFQSPPVMWVSICIKPLLHAATRQTLALRTMFTIFIVKSGLSLCFSTLTTRQQASVLRLLCSSNQVADTVRMHRRMSILHAISRKENKHRRSHLWASHRWSLLPPEFQLPHRTFRTQGTFV